MQSVTFGRPGLVYAVFALKWAIVLLCGVDIGYQRAWACLAQIDFTDITDLVLSASKGGSDALVRQDQHSDVGRCTMVLERPLDDLPAIILTPACENVQEEERLLKTVGKFQD